MPRKITATVCAVARVSIGTYIVKMEAERKIPRFKPGQFLHLALEPYEPSSGYWPDSRVFSILSVQEQEIAITYSVKGIFTQRMENELDVGKKVTLKLPFGEFCIADRMQNSETSNIVLIAGGTGISPFFSFLTGGTADHDVILYYGVRSLAHILLKDQLFQALLRNSRISLRLFLESIDINMFGSEKLLQIPNVSYTEGCIDCAAISQQNSRDSIFFISGPPGLIAVCSEALLGSGIAADNIVIDNWE